MTSITAMGTVTTRMSLTTITTARNFQNREIQTFVDSRRPPTLAFSRRLGTSREDVNGMRSHQDVQPYVVPRPFGPLSEWINRHIRIPFWCVQNRWLFWGCGTTDWTWLSNWCLELTKILPTWKWNEPHRSRNSVAVSYNLREGRTFENRYRRRRFVTTLRFWDSCKQK
jgi:hypothetical protein